MAQRFKLVIAYLGGPFHGWQRQPRQRTVQGELENALAHLTGRRRIAVVGAGRTDAGVHAAGQVAHADLPSSLPVDSLLRGANALLPPEIRVRSASAVGPRFHARTSAVGKAYTYRARWSTSRYPWLQMRSAAIAPVGQSSLIADLAEHLAGRHDWASFTVTEPAATSTERTLYRLRVRPRIDGLDLEFLGDGFLRYQVRRMVGALLEVAGGRRDAGWLLDLLATPQPGARIRTAPAAGLTLERVYYRRTPPMAAGRAATS